MEFPNEIKGVAIMKFSSTTSAITATGAVTCHLPVFKSSCDRNNGRIPLLWHADHYTSSDILINDNHEIEIF